MIPDFDLHGLIPPIRPGAGLGSSDRSPYPIDIVSFCERFGTTPERRIILNGLLDLRDDLAAAGVADGYQWVNGSFAEDVERLRGRAPADIDVVTFAVFANNAAQQVAAHRAPLLFDSHHCKTRYRVDHYVMGLTRAPDETAARRFAYWYSLWAHQRDTLRWKGFVSIDLRSNDVDARAWLQLQPDSHGGAA